MFPPVFFLPRLNYYNPATKNAGFAVFGSIHKLSKYLRVSYMSLSERQCSKRSKLTVFCNILVPF